MFGGLGAGEIFLILAVLVLIFGAKRLPELGGALGKGIREFKSSVKELGNNDQANGQVGPGRDSRPVSPTLEESRKELSEHNGKV